MAIPGYKIIGPDGRETEPFNSDALLSYARQGYVTPQTMVFDPTQGRWMPAVQVSALQSLNVSPIAPQGAAPLNPGAYAAPPVPGAYAPPQGGAGSRSVAKQRTLAIGVSVAAAAILGGLIYLGKNADRFSTSKQTVTTADQRYSVSLPGLWIHWTTHDPKIVEYLEPASGAGMSMVRVTHWQTLPGDLDRITANCSRLVAARLRSPGQIGPTRQTRIAGYDARQVEMNDSGDPGLHFRLTLFSTPDGIYQISDFEKMDSVDADRPMMDSLVASFHATGAHPANAPSPQSL